MSDSVLDEITKRLHERQYEEEQKADRAPTVGIYRDAKNRATAFGEAITILEATVNEYA